MKAPDPPLGDDAVLLRPWRADDAGVIARCCNDKLVSHFIPFLPLPYTLADAEAFIERTTSETEVNLAITDRATGAVLGAVGVDLKAFDEEIAEIGYWLAPEARGRGAATRALILLSRWTLREVPIARLQLTADVANLPSQAVAERAGFVREAVMRNGFGGRDGHRDCVVFSLLPDEL
jgi:RimJ/RimL family protein N-acetyltransferase